jgi:predicted glutamine amidotransferase
MPAARPSSATSSANRRSARLTLRDAEVQIDFSAATTPEDRVVIVATEPLTRDEVWTEGTPGTLWVFCDGRLQAALERRDPNGRPEWPLRADPASQ